MARFENLSARSRVLPALAVSASVLVFTVAVQLLMSLLYIAMSLLQGQGQGLGSTMILQFLAPSFVLTVLAFGFAVPSAVQLAVNALPLTVLAVVLTWIWSVRHSAHRVEAAIQVEV